MKNKEFNNGVHCVEYALMRIPEDYQRLLRKQFDYLEDYKNMLIKLNLSKIDNLRKENPEFDKAMEDIYFLNAKEGKVVDKEERSERLKEAYSIAKEVAKKNNLTSARTMESEMRKTLDDVYYVWLPDDVKSYAATNVAAAFESFFYKKGKHVAPKKYGHTCSMQSKALHPKTEDGTVREDVSQSSNRIIFVDGVPKYECWDLAEINDTMKKGSTHKKRVFDLYYKGNNELQKNILTNPYIGSTKLIRYWKKGKWRYRVQVTFEEVSPVVRNMQNQHHKVGIDFGTETIAWVRDDGECGIIEMTSDAVRVTDRIKELDVYMDHSRRATNPNLFKEDGQVKYSTEEMKKLGLRYEYSKRYRKARAERRERHRKLTEKRHLYRLEESKKLFQLGDNFVTENNSFAAWGTKLCRMAKKTHNKYGKGERKRDYTKLIHDNAVGSVDARLEMLCKQKNFEYTKIAGKSDFSLSTYNHFTDKNDMFEHLNNRLIVFDLSTVGDGYKNLAYSFDDTIQDFTYNEQPYVIQRDLYAAAKMLYCEPYTEKVKTKSGKTVEVTKYRFDKEGFKKFFDTKFYPKQEEYLLSLRKKVNNGEQVSGTIFGGI